MIMETEVAYPIMKTLTAQEIVDLYWLKKDYKEMTKQIDLYGSYTECSGATDFFYDLAEELEKFQEHVDDWSIFTGIVKEYHIMKDDQREEEETMAKVKLLSQFAQWVVDGIEYVNLDKEQMRLKIDEFMEDME